MKKTILLTISGLMCFLMLVSLAFGADSIETDAELLNDNTEISYELSDYNISLDDNQLEYRNSDWFNINPSRFNVEYNGEKIELRQDWYYFSGDDCIECYFRRDTGEVMFQALPDSYDAGERTLILLGVGEYQGEVRLDITITPCPVQEKNLDAWNVCINQGLVYNGKYKKPKFSIGFDKYPDDWESEHFTASLVKGVDYDVISEKHSNNLKVGTASYEVQIALKGNYFSEEPITLNAKYKIRPRKASIVASNAGRNSVYVRWKKNTEQVTGYKIVYGYYIPQGDYDDGDECDVFVKKTKFVKSKTLYKITLTGLKRNEYYHVRIYRYKEVNGKKIYSADAETIVKTKR